jgi:hypothetical protein
MKNLFLIYVLLVNGIIFSQSSKINKEEMIPSDIDFKGCVKKITLKTLRLDKMNAKIDSVKTISEVYFSKKGKIQSVNLYNKGSKDSWRTLAFDGLERITTISLNNSIVKFNSVNQYFSGNSEFPDSTKIFKDENYREKYINRFTNNLVTKQERYLNDTLQDFRVYQYNKQNQLIEDLYYNPENDSDETLVTSESDKGYKLSFYPERQTLYEHKKDMDTTIVIKISPRYSRKEVTKEVKNKNFELKIVEKYERNLLQEVETTWTSKDSLSHKLCMYYGTKEIKSYYNTFKNSKKIVYKSKSGFSNQSQEEVVTLTIETVYDKFKNWIKKTYFREGVLESMTQREIDYYCLK